MSPSCGSNKSEHGLEGRPRCDTPALLHRSAAFDTQRDPLFDCSVKSRAAPEQIGYPLHHAAEYLKTSHSLFQRTAEALVIYVARKHPTALIKVHAAGGQILRPAQHSLSAQTGTWLRHVCTCMLSAIWSYLEERKEKRC